MSTIQNLFEQAQLAEAAYANLWNSGTNSAITDPELVKAALQDTNNGGSFSQAQATAFVAHWRVVDQYTASAWGGITDGTGFSATVFESIDNPGQYSIAMRGTAGATDLMADAGDVLSDGLALDQIVDMYNYWQSLHHDLGYTAYKLETQLAETVQLTALWAQVAIPGASLYAKGVYDAYRAELQNAGLIVDIGPLGPTVRKLISGDSVVLLTGTPLAVGSGKLVGVNTVDASGHSLGGHLAMAFSRLFPTATGDVVAVNGAGFDLNNGNVNTLFSQLNGAAGFDAGKITNVVGSAAMNLVSQDWLFLQQPAGRSEIYTESYLPGSGTTLGHGSSQMADSLAVYNLLATLDPSLNTDPAGLTKIGDILRASSSTADRSLETTLDALGKVFGQTFTTATDDRESYYANLNQVQALFNPALSVSYTVDSLANMDAATLVANASDPANTAYRYALKELNAFAVVGADYSSFNQNGELTLYNPATRTGTLTDQYLKDRSAFLVDKNLSNTQDNLSNGMGYVDYAGTKQYFRDEGGATPTTVVLGGGLLANQLIAQPPDDIQQIRFGSDSATDTMQGGNKDDHLYGMAGDDTLQGNGGNDYLEGGRGTDKYLWNTGDGLDAIRDTDGLGSIVINGQALIVGESRDGGHTYTIKDSAGNDHTCAVLTGDINAAGGATLLIDNAVEVFNYRRGDLGLTLNGAAAPQPVQPGQTTHDIVGDPLIRSAAGVAPGGIAPDWRVTNTYNQQYAANPDGSQTLVSFDVDYFVVDADGNPLEAGGPAHDDLLNDTAANDRIVSGGGNDRIYLSRGGDDAVEAGDGKDYLNKSGAGSLTADLGAGDDILYGAASSSAIAASGGAGCDSLVGGSIADLLQGGMDADIIEGGTGDDRLFGSSEVTAEQAIANGNADIASGLQGDWLSGNAGDDILVAREGNDVLSGGGGNDLLIAGAGDDHILGDADYNVQSFDWTITPQADSTVFAPVTGATNPPDAGSDIIYTGDGADHVWAGDGNDVVYGEAGSDQLIGEAGNDILMGGAGDDNISGDASYIAAALHGDDYLDGGEGNDTLYGDGGNDILTGGNGNDTLWGGNGDDTLIGGAGADRLYGEAGANTLDGGDGADTLNSGGPGSTLAGGAGNDDISAAGGGNTLDGGAGDDILAADGGNNYLDGGDGTNSLQSTGSNNALFAGTGNDNLAVWGDGNYLDAGDGTNTLYAQGVNNELHAGTGNDNIQATGGNNRLDGGDGNNTLIADLGGNTLIAGAGNDYLSASGGGNYLDGGAGADTLLANGGNNELYGGAGDDTLLAYGGGNTLDGGAGRDLYVFDAGFGVNHISDSGTGGNTLRFNFAFAGSGIVVGLGSLKLSFPSGDELHIDNYDPNDPTGTCSIDNFVFDDRTLSLQAILDLGGPAVDFTIGPDITGTANADTLLGTDKSEHVYGLAGNDIIDAGARNDYIEGGAGNDIIDGGAGADIMIGGTGSDTYVVDSTGDAITEYANEGQDRVQSSVSYTLGNHVEELVLIGPSAGSGQAPANIDGTGNTLDNYVLGNGGNNVLSGGAGADWLDGGAGADTLSGGTGDDTLDGGAGADAMAGGVGNDTYYVDDAGDTATENVNEGIDRVYSTVTHTLSANLENLSLAGTGNIDGMGNELDNRIDGNSGDNILQGGAGNDTLMGWAGADTLMGGTGNDTYFVQDDGDTVTENANEGTDLVYSTVNYTLTANAENLTLTGTGNIGGGNELNNILTGNANADTLLGAGGNDTLYGQDGSDTLDGGGGADVMNGGYGNDTYVVDDAGDQVIESYVGKTYYSWGWPYTIQDIDTVNASISYTLGSNLENLNLTGAANLNGTGNTLNNTINGNGGDNVLLGDAGNDILNGGAGADWLSGGTGNDTLSGGTGADVMDGGAGNDTYYVDNAGDQVIETVVGAAQWWNGQFVAGDAEQVYSSVSFILGANLEYLTLTGADNIDGTGNALSNVITGNDGINVLSGGAGDDTYHVQTAGDTVIEGAGDGYDRVYTNVDFTLSGNTEYLSLNDGVVVGIGDDSDNTIDGNRADNVLEGRGGNDYLDGYAGNDTISGGDGNDIIYGGYDGYEEWGLISNSDALDGGAGDDNIDGGSGNDTISGGTGNDVLFGGNDDGGEGGDPLPNNDVIDGGEGDDSIDGGTGADRLYGGAGNDTIYGGDDGWSNNYYDYAQQISTPVSSDDFLDGGAGDDVLDGGSGNDLLRGGEGEDELYGGDGNDVIHGSSHGGFAEDAPVVARSGEVTVSAAEDDGSIPLANITGSAANYTLQGIIGDGPYADPTTGNGWDFDFYKFDNLSAGSIISASTYTFFDAVVGLYDSSGNLAIENGYANWVGGNPDYDLVTNFSYTIDISGDYYLAISDWNNWLPGDPFDTVLGSDISQYSFGGGSYTATFNVTPSTSFPRFSNDYLDATTAIDDMQGGYGDDTYVVDGLYTRVADTVQNDCGDLIPVERLQWETDRVTEYGGEGYDIVMSSASFTLSDNVEELQLIFDSNTAATDQQFHADMVIFGQDGTGNDLNNVIVGNELNNRLDGGLGVDTLEGGSGDDTYVIDQAGDTIIELAEDGIDTVESSIDYSLDGTNLENLTLLDDTSTGSGQVAINGTGNAADNVLQGNAAGNVLEGLDGNDKLIGGLGDDILLGGAGNDRYVFRLGDGADVIDDWQGNDTLFIGNDLTAADIAMERVGGDLLVSINNTMDSITLTNWFTQAEGVRRIEFCDGSVLENLFDQAPVAGPIQDQVTRQDTNFSFIIPVDSFVDPEGGGLTYSTAMADGAALPSWLTFDAATRTFSGVPTNWDVGALDVTVAATDAGGLSASSSFVLDVLNVNDAPTVVNPTPDQFITEGQAFSFTLPSSAGGDSFLNDATDTGTPDNSGMNYDAYLWGDIGNDIYSFGRGDGNVLIYDWDSTIGNVDTVQFSPGILPSDISIRQLDQWGSVILSVNGTGDSLTLGNWLYQDAEKIEQLVFADGTVWGVIDIMSMISTAPTSGNDYITSADGNDTIYALAGDDGVHAGAEDDAVIGGAGNDWLEGEGGSDILSGGSGADELDADWSYMDTASDMLLGGAGDDYLNSSIANDLLVGGQGNDYVAGDDGNDVVLFNRGDGNDWYYSDWSENGVPLAQRADTVSLGGGITYIDLAFERDSWNNLILQLGNGETITFANWFDASWQDNKAISTLQLVVEVMPGYDANFADPLLNKRIQQFDFAGLANRFEAAQAADPTITTWQLAPHLTDFSLGGSDTAAIGGNMAYLYGKNGNLDGLSEAELRAQLNDVGFGTGSQTLAKANLGTGATVFNDIDAIHGDTLTYSATLADGAALPGWLVFDAATGTFSGNPGSRDAGTLNVAVTATDSGGLTATSVFNLDVIGLNAAPIAVSDMIAVTEDEGISTVAIADLLANDSDPDAGDTLSVSAFDALTAQGNTVSLDTEGNLVFDIGNRYQSLGAGEITRDSFNYTVSDAGGLASTATVDVAIAGVNDAPAAATAISGQQTNEDASLSFTIPVGTFTDIDNDDVLTYNTTLADGTALPGWLTFDAATQTFSGIPSNGDVGNLNVQVTVTDTGGLSAASNFMLNVINVNDPPTANADTGAATEDGGAVQMSAATLLANDTDPDFIHGDMLNIVGVSQAASGAAVPLLNGAVQYDIGSLYQSLAQGQTATDTFSYTVSDMTGATSTATVTMTVTGVNDGPVTANDAAAIQEDAALIATGNVLSNDSDVDRGTVLSVADAGIRAGSYGSLSLAADGGYSYALDNASQTVQSLGRAAQVVEHFGYTATDGIAGAASVLDVFLSGANDAPILVAPLADQDFSRDKHFSWQMPEGSFTDIDQGDTLAYAATLADGSALPDWLSFDAATRTFSGETPKKAGFVDVMVTATDVAADGSTAGSLSASDVFRISVSRGNEGVGNGEDAPPPGHDRNCNDGGGTAPGRPGRKGGNGQHATGDDAHGREDAHDKHKDDSPSHGGKDFDNHRTDELIRAWFEEESTSERYASFSALDRHGAWGGQIDRQVKRNVARGVSGDVSSAWERMNARLKKHLEQSGGDEGIFVDSGMDSRSFGLFDSQNYSSAAQLGMGNGQQMKTLAGLKEGLERLSC